MNSAIEADDAYSLLKEKVKHTMQLWEKELISIINDSQQKEETPPSVDPTKFSRRFIAMIEGGILLAKSMEDSKYFIEVMQGLQEQLDTHLR